MAVKACEHVLQLARRLALEAHETATKIVATMRHCISLTLLAMWPAHRGALCSRLQRMSRFSSWSHGSSRRTNTFCSSTAESRWAHEDFVRALCPTEPALCSVRVSFLRSKHFLADRSCSPLQRRSEAEAAVETSTLARRNYRPWRHHGVRLFGRARRVMGTLTSGEENGCGLSSWKDKGRAPREGVRVPGVSHAA
jgi:hypothetical protein